MPRRAEVVLSEEARDVLERWARRPKSSQALALRCRIVLAAAEGTRSKDIAARLGCSASTVGRWRGRFAERGLDGLHDEPRPGRPRSIGDDQIERVIVKTLEEQPPDATHWSTRSMAAATGMSQTAISRIWRAFGLKPHRTEAFKLSPDLSTRSATSSGSTSTLLTPRSCCASTRSPRSRRSTARRRCCR
jgi:transposase